MRSGWLLFSVGLLAISACKRADTEPVLVTLTPLKGGEAIQLHRRTLEHALARVRFLRQDDGGEEPLPGSLRTAILERAIDDVLLLREASRLGITTSTQAVQAELDALKAPYTEDAFQKQLSDNYLTQEDMVRHIRRDQKREAVLKRHLRQTMNILPGEVRAAFDALSREARTRPTRVRVAQILVRRERTANRLYQTLRYQPDAFAELAREHSVGPAKARGGDLGWFRRGGVGGLIELVCFELDKGQVSRPQSSSDGFHLFRLLAREEAREERFEEAAPRLARELLDTRMREAEAAYLDALRAAYRIEKNLDALGPLE